MQSEDINKEEEKIYEIKDDVSRDQASNEEGNTTGITLNVDIRIKPSIEEPQDLELKTLPEHLEYAFLGEESTLPVIIATSLANKQKEKLLEVLQKHKRAIALKIYDINGISPSFCTNMIMMEDDYKPSTMPQRRMNPNMKEVVKTEAMKLLDAGLIYSILHSAWVSLVQV